MATGRDQPCPGTAPPAPAALVATADPGLAASLAGALAGAGFTVGEAVDARAAEALLARLRPAVVVIDAAVAGAAALAMLAREAAGAGTVLLGGAGAAGDPVAALEAGADDCFPVPPPMRLLAARARSLARRAQPWRQPPPSPAALPPGLPVDPARHALAGAAGRGDVRLTRGELAVLLALARAGGAVVPRARLLEAVGGTDTAAGERTADVLVSRLRAKLAAAGHPRGLIATAKGLGFRLACWDGQPPAKPWWPAGGSGVRGAVSGQG